VHAAGEFVCVACGHRAVRFADLPACAVCEGALWEREASSPFSRLADATR